MQADPCSEKMLTHSRNLQWSPAVCKYISVQSCHTVQHRTVLPSFFKAIITAQMTGMSHLSKMSSEKAKAPELYQIVIISFIAVTTLL